MRDLVLIAGPGSEHEQGRILQLADWMGVTARRVTIGDRPAMDRLIAEVRHGECVVLSMETLAHLRELSPSHVLQDFIDSRCPRLLVFSVGYSPDHQELLSWLTTGAVSGLAPPTASQFFMTPDCGRRYSRAFAGHGFTQRKAVPLSSFELGNARDRNTQEILLADDRPVFLATKRGQCELFLLALAQIPDIRTRLSQDTGVEEYYDRLIPFLILLRHCFADTCWHGAERTARLIIDDPLLNQTYGFLNYAALRRSMRATGYATSIAFIPWNHWRTSRRKAKGIIDEDAGLSICVHGCDHTNREFEDVDPASLQRMADTALTRMERHKARTGLPFDPVMVFPQGRFSSPALLALRNSGYLAAVNTTCFPTNAGAEPLTIADFLRPAITKYYGFPVFQRRYPRRLIDFAFDLFIGRPVLLVQHQDDFRSGYDQLEEFVNGLHALEPTLTWDGLSCQLMRSCIIRSLAENSTEVRFFTRQFTFKNARLTPTHLVFSRDEPETSAVSSVLINDTRVPFAFQNGSLIFEYQADAGKTIEVQIADQARPQAPTLERPGVRHSIQVGARRALSELRDNLLVKHPRLQAAATELATRMKVTGQSDQGE
jgi:hypothetical protein